MADPVPPQAELPDLTVPGMRRVSWAGEEEHADWLETQLALIRQVGEANHLAQQIRE